MARKRPSRRIHLISHAHIDPVWLWTWEDGLTEALSTFRIAVEFCERHRDFIFCHNEALLYRWVEEHDPVLFKRIVKMVHAGRWHIMGGAYLQPDINAPSGESHLRQYLYGREYFREKFGVRPRTAWNIDSFGQAEGFVQILAGCGIEYYIFSRPRPSSMDLPMGPFRWRDRSGREVIAERYFGSYNTRGNVERQLERLLDDTDEGAELLFLWGFGDHGGGPSREEYRVLRGCMRTSPDLAHSTPDRYFDEFRDRIDSLPVIRGELQKASLGCYTSMARVKRAHREVEGMMAQAERIAAVGWWRGRCPYPKSELDRAWRQIMFGEFHDILPGTCIPPGESDTLSMFGLCRETVARVRTRVFLRLLDGEPKAGPRTAPVFIFNPHGFPVSTDLEFRFNHSYTTDPLNTISVRGRMDGRPVATQRERGLQNVKVDWSMQACCHVKLPPFSVRRLDAVWRRRKPPALSGRPRATAKRLRFTSRQLKVVINPKTGLVDWAGPVRARRSYLSGRAMRPAVFHDVSHSWSCGSPDKVKGVREGRYGNVFYPPWGRPEYFRLATRHQAAEICLPPGGRREVDPVRIVEDGPVRTIVEAVFQYRRSAIIRRYVFSRNSPLFEIRDRISWNEKSMMLKVECPLGFQPGSTTAETPYSACIRPAAEHHFDMPNQRWVKASAAKGGRWVGVVNNGSYGHSLYERTLYVNVLRSPPYGISEWTAEAEGMEDRCLRRQDQGEHEVRFGFLFGKGASDLPLIRAAGVMNAPPVWISHHPPGPGRRDRISLAAPAVEVSANNVEVTALKRAERGNALVIRLMEHAGRRTNCEVRLSRPNGRVKVVIGPYRLKTVVVRRAGNRLAFEETNLVEESCR